MIFERKSFLFHIYVIRSEARRIQHPITDEVNKIADKAREKAWNDFKVRYSNANLCKFSAQVLFDDKRQATGKFTRVDQMEFSQAS